MTEDEKKMNGALEELSDKFAAVWSNVYFRSLSQTFSINLPGFSDYEVVYLNEFCQKHNLMWVVMQEHSKGGRGISISFYENKTK